MDEDTCDAALNKLDDILMIEFDKACPIQTKTIRKKYVLKLWITDRLKMCIKKCQRFYHVFRQNSLSSNDYNSYGKFCD